MTQFPNILVLGLLMHCKGVVAYIPLKPQLLHHCIGKMATIMVMFRNINIVELTKALDTFVLTSGIGQFAERLCLIDAFAHQILEECS